MNTLVVTTLGRPRPKQSARFVNGRVVGVVRTQAGLKFWTNLVKKAAAEALEAANDDVLMRDIYCGAVRLDATFYMPTKDGKRWGKFHMPRPDRGNLLKAAEDALEAAGVVQDDKRIAAGDVVKLWAPAAGATLKLTPCDRTPDTDDADDLGVGFIATENSD